MGGETKRMAKEYTNGFYNSKSWLDCRESYLRTQDYICERCGSPSKIVHHKEYITPKTINDPSVTLSHDNLEALCQECHNREHHKDSLVTRQGLSFDKDGQLVQARALGE